MSKDHNLRSWPTNAHR